MHVENKHTRNEVCACVCVCVCGGGGGVRGEGRMQDERKDPKKSGAENKCCSPNSVNSRKPVKRDCPLPPGQKWAVCWVFPTPRVF